MNKRPIQLSPPHFDAPIALESLSGDPGQIIGNFEREMAGYVGRNYAVALNSGTSAIHLALKVLGVERGDYVLCQSNTYAATAFPILYEGAQPVFIDSEPDTGNMDAKLLKQALEELKAESLKPSAHRSFGGDVKAIICVDLYGMPAEWDEIMSIASEHNIPVIEDAAEALGSIYRDHKCGSFGRIGILSFNSNKVITSGGGGMLLTDDESLASKALYYASQSKDPGPVMNHQEVGFNYRMNHVNAALGRQQFREIDQRVDHRRKVFDYYKKQLSEIPGISFAEGPQASFSNRWLTTMLVDPKISDGIARSDIQEALKADDIVSRPLWKPMHLQPVFHDSKAFVNGVSDRLFEKGLCLPSGANLTTQDLERIIKVIRRVFSK